MRQFRFSLPFVHLLISILLLMTAISAQTPELQLNQPLERQIKGGVIQFYQINLKGIEKS
jgi:hypothetical protein